MSINFPAKRKVKNVVEPGIRRDNDEGNLGRLRIVGDQPMRKEKELSPGTFGVEFEVTVDKIGRS